MERWDGEWNILRSWLPEDLQTPAKDHGFLRRASGVQDAERWLRLILMHAGGGLSLEQSVCRAAELGLAKVSAVALFKRLRNAHDWLQSLTLHLIGEQRRLLGEAGWPKGRPVRLIDATDVQEPGTTGSDWRIHYSIRLPDLCCEHYELTDSRGAEKLGRFAFAPGEIVLADRGYCHRSGAALVLESGADLVLRLNWSAFPLLDSVGKPLDLLRKVRSLRGQKTGEWKVIFTHEGKTYPLRLCAVRKSRNAAALAEKKARRKAKRNGHRIHPHTVELSSYVLILSSLEPERWSAADVLRLYRGRWQIELVFKRFKSLLGVGHVPKKNDASASAWLQAKLLAAMLIERTIIEARFFSPWGFPLRET